MWPFLAILEAAERQRHCLTRRAGDALWSPPPVALSEMPVHDVETDASPRGVLESLWNGSEDAKSERLPKPYGVV